MGCFCIGYVFPPALVTVSLPTDFVNYGLYLYDPTARRSSTEVAVLAETLADKGKPPEDLGVTHWSARLMAERLGISFASVARI